MAQLGCAEQAESEATEQAVGLSLAVPTRRWHVAWAEGVSDLYGQDLAPNGCRDVGQLPYCVGELAGGFQGGVVVTTPLHPLCIGTDHRALQRIRPLGVNEARVPDLTSGRALARGGPAVSPGGSGRSWWHGRSAFRRCPAPCPRRWRCGGRRG
ncbi:hypothetical protein SM007_39315 [Streptomyces avermitilis]|nr:hypothetical protein SM007_39315 [Streptomyces avermitilis]